MTTHSQYWRDEYEELCRIDVDGDTRVISVNEDGYNRAPSRFEMRCDYDRLMALRRCLEDWCVAHDPDEKVFFETKFKLSDGETDWDEIVRWSELAGRQPIPGTYWSDERW